MSRLAKTGSSGRRIGLSAADQCMSTVSNVVFVAFAAHVLTARSFGALSLIYVSIASAQLLARATVGEVLIIKDQSERFPRMAREAIAAALTLGLGTTVVILGVAVPLGGLIAQSAWAICPFVPLLFLQDTLRYLAFAEGRPGHALESDTLWVAVQVATCASALAMGSASLTVAALTWTLPGSCAALLLFARRPVRLGLGCARWFRNQKATAPYYLLEAAAVNGSAQLFTVGVALMVGLEATGALRAATVLFGPMNTLVMAAAVALVPELVQRRRRGDHRLRPAFGISAALMVVTVLWGLVLVLGQGTLSAVFGDSWTAARAVAPYFFLRLLLGSASTGPLLWLRATGRGNATTASRVWTSIITLVAGVTGALLWDAVGAAAGLVLAQAFNLTTLWTSAWRVRRKQPLDVVLPSQTATSATRNKATEIPGVRT